MLNRCMKSISSDLSFCGLPPVISGFFVDVYQAKGFMLVVKSHRKPLGT